MIYYKSLQYEKPEGELYQYPYNLPFLQGLNDICFSTPVTIFIGENGSGKSTIIECIAELAGINLEGGSKNNKFSTYESTSESLADSCLLVRAPKYPKDSYFYRAESYFSLMTELDKLGVSNDYFDRELHHLSRGEGFLQIIANRFFGDGVYLLDEPESGLSFQSQLSALVYIDELVKHESQFIISTHSPILMLYPGATIYQITDDGIKEVFAKDNFLFDNWEMLINNSDQLIHRLLR